MPEAIAQTAAFLVGIASSVVAALLFTAISTKYNARFSFRRIVALVLELAEQLQNDGFTPDFIVAIDRNSTITGGILAGNLGLKTVISVATISCRRNDGSRETIVAQGYTLDADALSGKKVLVYICFNDSGTSLDTVARQVMSTEKSPSDVRTAALFTTSSPRFMPKYFARKVGTDLRIPIHLIMQRMPWVTPTWKHVLGSERLRR
ncbi:phosphoribosyltransferase-like protein [Parvibaculum lavamentivorans DS-1]|uniref:Phosphoribosyltransferase-like protein n=1 Tax=Parvibaculum lavamentivorans (strain DS-1 / DSM 13023 / NCIMB 13966) TaxID=402881 RepID=A7HPW9_PARL1|nr:phosphoribosyltransferase family protein [Parvibaculum lavamentivorans]ABS61952.1 phosphoribosyltransferase-like protein [Parvibaculum lavamentivorans DS-1]